MHYARTPPTTIAVSPRSIGPCLRNADNSFSTRLSSMVSPEKMSVPLPTRSLERELSARYFTPFYSLPSVTSRVRIQNADQSRRSGDAIGIFYPLEDRTALRQSFSKWSMNAATMMVIGVPSGCEVPKNTSGISVYKLFGSQVRN